MKKKVKVAGKVKYTDAPKWVDEIFDHGVVVDDSFLPSPEEFRAAREREGKQRITIMIDSDALNKFKKYAAANDMKYQTLVNDVVSTYAKKNL